MNGPAEAGHDVLKLLLGEAELYRVELRYILIRRECQWR